MFYSWLSFELPLAIRKSLLKRGIHRAVFRTCMLHKHIRGNARCYDTGRTRNVLSQPIIVGKIEHAQFHFRCIYRVRNSI